MAQLGSIFPEATPETSRGADLRCTVKVPRYALGAPGGVQVEIPRRLEHDGLLIGRVQSPHEAGDHVTLNLPEQVPDGATLRLRGQGGACEGGQPGDLYLEIVLVDLPPPEPPAHTGPAPLPMAWIVAAVAAALLAWFAWSALGR